MASAFTKLFLPGHRKRNSLSIKQGNQDSARFLSNSSKDASSSASTQASKNQTAPTQHTYDPRTRGALTTDSLNTLPASQAEVMSSRRKTLSSFTFPDVNLQLITGPPLTAADSVAKWDSSTFPPPDPTAPLDHKRFNIQGDDNVSNSIITNGLGQAASLDQSLSPTSIPQDDDEDLDSNPIFLSLSEDSQLQSDWDRTRLALIPLQRSLPLQKFKDTGSLQNLAFVASHAFAPSKLFRDQYVSVRSLKPGRENEPFEAYSLSPQQQSLPSLPDSAGLSSARVKTSIWDRITLTANIEPDQKWVNVSISYHESKSGSLHLSRSSNRLRVVAETTIYRTVPIQGTTALSDSSKPTSNKGFQVISRNSNSYAKNTEKVKIRVLSVQGWYVPYDLDATKPTSSEFLSLDSNLNSSLKTNRNVSPSGSIAFPKVEADMESTPSPTEPGHFQQKSQDCRNASPNVTTTSPQDSDGSRFGLSHLVLQHVPVNRSFSSDIELILAPPPALNMLKQAFHDAFQVLFTSAIEFTTSFVFVKGFDVYNANRIRRGIWFKSWKVLQDKISCLPQETCGAMQELSNDAALRLKLLLDNIVMGYVHCKMYDSIAEQFTEADESLNDILTLYGTRGIGLIELGVHVPTLRHRPNRLERVISLFSSQLSPQIPTDFDQILASIDHNTILERLSMQPSRLEDVSSDSESSECGVALAAGLSLNAGLNDKPPSRKQKLRLRTPLETMQAFKATIDEIGLTVQRSNFASSRASLNLLEQPLVLSTDDLLPILAYVLIKTRPPKLLSCLYYARTFQLASIPVGDLTWSLVTFEAVIEYLRSDPLRVRDRKTIDFDSLRSRTGINMLPQSVMDRSSNSRSSFATGSVATHSHYHNVSMSRSSSANRDRRVSLPATALDGWHSPTSPLSPSLGSGSVLPPRGAGASNSSSVDESYLNKDGCTDDTSPCLTQDGFKLPGLPASISSRRSSRTGQRPNSVFSLVEDGDSGPIHEGSLEAYQQAALVSSPSRQSSTRSRTISLNSGASDLQIRPQIVRTVRRTTPVSSRTDLNSSIRMERTGSAGSPHVRVVGSPRLTSDSSGRDSPGSSSPPRSDRRKSLDSWSALSIFSATKASFESKRVIDLSRQDSLASRSEKQFNHTDSASSSEHLIHHHASSSGSWLPWSSDGGGSKRPSTPGTSSVISLEDAVSPSSTFSSLARSGSGSGYVANVDSRVLGTTIGSYISRRPPSIRSNSSQSSGQGLDEYSLGVSPGKQSQMSSSNNLGLPPRRRLRARFLSTSATGGAGVPLPPKIDRESSVGDFAYKSSHLSLGSLSAMMASSLSQSSQASHQGSTSSSSPFPSPRLGEVGSGNVEPNTPTQAQASLSHYFVAGGHSAPDGLLPAIFRLHVPSPVTEVADPMSSMNLNTPDDPDSPGCSDRPPSLPPIQDDPPSPTTKLDTNSTADIKDVSNATLPATSEEADLIHNSFEPHLKPDSPSRLDLSNLRMYSSFKRRNLRSQQQPSLS